MYLFLILSDISVIRSDLRSFFAITLCIMMFTMMNTAVVFFLWELILYSSPLSKSLSLSETLLIRVYHTWKIMNWLSIAMISVAVFLRFMHSHLPKSTSFELRWRSLSISLSAAERQSHWGVLKGSWLSSQCES